MNGNDNANSSKEDEAMPFKEGDADGYKDDNERERLSANDTTSPARNHDSLIDFKTPIKLKPDACLKMDTKKMCTKPKMKVYNANKKSTTNKHKQRKTNSKYQANGQSIDSAQPSIESSFFKTESKGEAKAAEDSTKLAYLCPLCLKALKDENSHTVHTKNCAIKHNISTRRLLDAVQLQECQAEERRSLGLLAAPKLHDRKKAAPRRMDSYRDPDLELALALSKSLHECEETRERQEFELLGGTTDSAASSNSAECRKRIVSNFERFGKQPIESSSVKPKKKKLIGKTILQTRTAEERERLLTERIAEILMEDDRITQKLTEETSFIQTSGNKPILRSRLLQKLHQTEDTLWDKARLLSDEAKFYVKNLSIHVIPAINGPSEFSTRNERTIKDDIVEKGKEATDRQILSNKNSTEDMLQRTSNPLYEESNRNRVDREFIDDLVTDWSKVLNDSSTSDIIIFVDDSNTIRAHKLIFSVRCPSVLQDSKPNVSAEFPQIKEALFWTDVPENTALAFLEFVYCGAIKKYSNIFCSNDALSDIKNLAKKYKMEKLYAYLEACSTKSNNCTTMERDSEDCYNSSEDGNRSNCHVAGYNETRATPQTSVTQKEILLQVSNCLVSSNTSLGTCNINEASNGQIDRCSDISKYNENVITKINPGESPKIGRVHAWQTTAASPDMFDDMEDISVNEDKYARSNKDDFDSNVLYSQEDSSTAIRNDGKLSSLIGVKNAASPESVSVSNNNCVQQTEQIVITDLEQTDWDGCGEFNTSMTSTPKFKELPSAASSSPRALKQKSNLTLFIEKIQKENARNDYDTDSDVNSPMATDVDQGKNPFKIKLESFADNSASSASTVKIQNVAKRKKGLAGLEYLTPRTADEDPAYSLNFREYANERSAESSSDSETCSSRPKRIPEHSFEKKADGTENILTIKLHTPTTSPKIMRRNEPHDFLLSESPKSGRDGRRYDKIDTISVGRDVHSLNNSSNCFNGDPTGSTDKRDNDRREYTSNIKSNGGVDAAKAVNNSILDLNESLFQDFDIENHVENKENVIETASTVSPCSTFATEGASESDTDTEDISMYTRYKRKRTNNSIHKYRNILMKQLEIGRNVYRTSRDSTTRGEDSRSGGSEVETERNYRVSMNDVESINFSDFDSLESSTSTVVLPERIRESVARCSRPTRCLSNTSNDTVNVHVSTSIRSNNIKVANKEESKNTASLDYSIYDAETDTENGSSNKCSQNVRESESYNCDARGNSGQCTSRRGGRSLSVTGDISNETNRGVCDNFSETRTSDPVEKSDSHSPILICSSPEAEFGEARFDIYNEQDNKRLELNTSELNNIRRRSIARGNSRFARFNTIAYGQCHNEPVDSVDKSNICETESSFEIKENRENFGRGRNSTGASSGTWTSVKKLKRRSLSEGSFRSVGASSANPLSTRTFNEGVQYFEKPTNNKIHGAPSDFRIVDGDVTPPPDYDNMASPELRENLKKYGLKLQSRKNAVKLLAHIYDETHPLVDTPFHGLPTNGEYSISCIDDEGPPVKRANIDNCALSRNAIARNDSEAAHLIAELDESEDSSPADKPISSKDAFLKLIKQDRELHNKILNYDPLDIVTLHESLKAQGLGVKRNALMDFLDEQCITFQQPEKNTRGVSRAKPFVSNH